VNDKWYRFDDSRVTVETESCVMKEAMSHSKSNAYMLQYVSKDEFGNGNWGLSSSIGRVVETRAGSSIELDDNSECILLYLSYYECIHYAHQSLRRLLTTS